MHKTKVSFFPIFIPMKTLGSIRQQFLADLTPIYDQDEILSLFHITAEHLLNFPRLQISLKLQESLSESQSTEFSRILQQLQSGRPIQHIIGKAPFYGLEFIVSENTLIPRPETEELVDLIISENKSIRNLRIIDIGTGSGCIAISLKKNLKDAEVSAVDISTEAIEIAKQNAINNGIPVNFRCLDILEWDLVFDEEEQFDIIVSNPPYVTQDEKDDMHHNVLQFEPHTALFVEDSAPLLFYDNIASCALKHLKTNGTLYFEINQYLSKETKDLLLKKGFSKVDILNDINSVPRMIRSSR